VGETLKRVMLVGMLFFIEEEVDSPALFEK